MMIRRMVIPVSLTLSMLAVFPGPGASYSHVLKKVKKDGTIHFSNIPDAGASKTGRAASLNSPYDGLITAVAGREGVDPHLIKCIVKVESDFNPDAVSSAGAMGLMQLMQDTARLYGLRDPFDPEKNLEAGTRHFRGLLSHFKNDVPLALAAYHAGLGRVSRRMAIPPIRSTIDYVNRVMRLYNGTGNFDSVVIKLYRKIDRDGTILFYSK